MMRMIRNAYTRMEMDIGLPLDMWTIDDYIPMIFTVRAKVRYRQSAIELMYADLVDQDDPKLYYFEKISAEACKCLTYKLAKRGRGKLGILSQLGDGVYAVVVRTKRRMNIKIIEVIDGEAEIVNNETFYNDRSTEVYLGKLYKGGDGVVTGGTKVNVVEVIDVESGELLLCKKLNLIYQ